MSQMQYIQLPSKVCLHPFAFISPNAFAFQVDILLGIVFSNVHLKHYTTPEKVKTFKASYCIMAVRRLLESDNAKQNATNGDMLCPMPPRRANTYQKYLYVIHLDTADPNPV